jgi:hypothetical protein
VKRTPLTRRLPLLALPLARSSSLTRATARKPRPPATGHGVGSRPRAERLAGARPAGRNDIPAAVRARVLERDGLRCLRCGASVAHGPRSVHHRQPRGMGGTSDPLVHRLSLLALVCGSGTTGCHGDIESWRARSRTLGWLISRFEPADPQTIPIYLDSGDVVWLHDDGTKTVQRVGR